MLIKNEHIVNTFTDLDELIQGIRKVDLNKPLFTHKEMFEMGQFYQWAKHIVDNNDCDLDAETEVPEEFAWVVGETQGW